MRELMAVKWLVSGLVLGLSIVTELPATMADSSAQDVALFADHVVELPCVVELAPRVDVHWEVVIQPDALLFPSC